MSDPAAGPGRRAALKAMARAGLGAWASGAAPGLLTGCAGRHRLPVPAAFGTAPATGTDGAGSLRARAAARDVLYGCAVNGAALGRDAGYRKLVQSQAGIVVAENAMKWGPLRPARDSFAFSDADALVLFAETNGIQVRGHNLCWHRQLPAWFAAEANPGNARELLGEHIARVAGRYAGRMHSWDVVNEAILVEDGRADGLRRSPWLELIGPEYPEIAFHSARAADPRALLAYNDYGLEGEDAAAERKRAAVLMLLRRLRTRNVPVDAVGVQGHISAGGGTRYGPGLVRFLAEARGLGLEIFITEMDVNDRALAAGEAVRDLAVADAYRRFLETVLAQGWVAAVLTWGITDRYTWLNSEDARPDRLPERCLPFDAEGRPVEAFFAIRSAFDTAAVRAAADGV